MDRCVVVGSGCAGLACADALASLGHDHVLLVTEAMADGTSRNTGSDKQTYYKLSLSGDAGDSVGAMARDLAGRDAHGDTALCQAALSVPCFMKLCALGVPFPQNRYGEYVGYRTDHDETNRATSAGPLTSRYMTEALERSVREKNVEILDGAVCVRVLRDGKGVTGAEVFLPKEKRLQRIPCADLVLATGGPAAIYRDVVYPPSQKGMSSLAFLAGAKGENLDCWQYGLASTGFRWNVSGSYQQVIPRYVSVDAEGRERDFLSDALGAERAMALTFLKGYQWPFDASRVPGSSEVDLLVKAEGDRGRRVYMDFTRNPAGYATGRLSAEARAYLEGCGALKDTPIQRLLAMNPPAAELYQGHGIDLARDRLEVRVCAQHHNGGIAVSASWETCVPGLYACGEAAGTFGRRRPGGSALNATQTGAVRAAERILAVRRRADSPGSPEPLRLCRGGEAEILDLQARMSRFAAFERDASGMRELKATCEALLSDRTPCGPGEAGFDARLRLTDTACVQREVLSAMLFALSEQGDTPGVLETADGVSRRIPARGQDGRELWFEKVWAESRGT